MLQDGAVTLLLKVMRRLQKCCEMAEYSERNKIREVAQRIPKHCKASKVGDVSRGSLFYVLTSAEQVKILIKT
jgi:hypothetical protein